MAHLPGQNFCGPFTNLNQQAPPTNLLDTACEDHDRAYRKRTAYVAFNNADQELVNKSKRIKTVNSAIVRAAFDLKKLFAPKDEDWDPDLQSDKRGVKRKKPDFSIPSNKRGKRKQTEQLTRSTIKIAKSGRIYSSPYPDRTIRRIQYSESYRNIPDITFLSKRKKRRYKFKKYPKW